MIGLVQQAKAHNVVPARAGMTAATAAVLRRCCVKASRSACRVPRAELLRGDVLMLTEGDAVGADARLLQQDTLHAARIDLCFAEMRGPVKDTLKRCSGWTGRIGVRAWRQRMRRCRCARPTMAPLTCCACTACTLSSRTMLEAGTHAGYRGIVRTPRDDIKRLSGGGGVLRITSIHAACGCID